MYKIAQSKYVNAILTKQPSVLLPAKICYLLLFLMAIGCCLRCQRRQVERAPVIAEDTLANDTIRQEVVHIDSAYELMLLKKAEHIDSFFTRQYKHGLFNGAVLFAENGKIIYQNAFGYANFREKDTLTLQTPFQLASVSKPLTALAILLLKEKKYLSLEDTVQRFFPEFPYPGITVRMLLTHRSGLPNYMYFADALWNDRKVTITNQDVLCLMQTYKPDIYYIPDYHYNYCNTNFSLLASIVEKTSGMPFSRFMERYIFRRLGMKHSLVSHPFREEQLDDAAVGYTRTNRKAEDTYLNGVTGDKGIYSTVEDLYKLDQALYEDTFLTQQTLEEAFTPQHPDLYDHDNYGLGWRINTQPDCSRIVFHSGWWKGFRTNFIRILDKKQTIIVLANTDQSKYISVRQLIDLMETPL